MIQHGRIAGKGKHVAWFEHFLRRGRHQPLAPSQVHQKDIAQVAQARLFDRLPGHRRGRTDTHLEQTLLQPILKDRRPRAPVGKQPVPDEDEISDDAQHGGHAHPRQIE